MLSDVLALPLAQKKVRDVKFCRETGRVATVSADGTLMVLDAQLGLIRTVRRLGFGVCSRWLPARSSIDARLVIAILSYQRINTCR